MDTIPAPTRERGTAWSVTCNLRTVARTTVDDSITRARSLGWGVEGQIEQGAEGTQHYQLLLRTPQVRFSAVKKVFPTAHIELARNVKALQNYVHKEESRVEALKTVEVTYLTYPMVRNKFFAWFVDEYPDYDIRDADERLQYWDRFIGLSITEGMDCDLIGMNPQHRGCISKYWYSYIARVRRQQTDSQEQSVAVPT